MNLKAKTQRNTEFLTTLFKPPLLLHSYISQSAYQQHSESRCDPVADVLISEEFKPKNGREWEHFQSTKLLSLHQDPFLSV